ncbi:helix-turn-helix domain-containing protein [Aliivibrio fischeri]|uniref:helix-turn-helix domain-containing protein n=1 Tax=Aliivibrio fischeri TaxID=668 RepID=UPI0012D85E9C|nr:helix-turn-helix domain-containing protein [Aliivibrio fischeri]
MSNQFTITKTIIETNLKQSHGITPTEKCVLITLSSYFGKSEGRTMYSCYPSQSRIAKEVGCVRSTVNNALQKFEALGFVRSRWQLNRHGANTSKLYTWLGIPVTDEQDERESSIEPSDTEVIGTRTDVEETISEIRTVVESTPSTQSEVSHESVPSSDWWNDLEAEIANESPF